MQVFDYVLLFVIDIHLRCDNNTVLLINYSEGVAYSVEGKSI